MRNLAVVLFPLLLVACASTETAAPVVAAAPAAAAAPASKNTCAADADCGTGNICVKPEAADYGFCL